MMEKLTEEQIERVEHFLDRNKIKYIDVRLEVLDHIISDIENNYLAKDIAFEEAFPNVVHKWKQHFTETSSLVFGLAYSAPNMIIKKAKSIYKKFFLMLIVVTLSTTFLIFRFDDVITEFPIGRFNLIFGMVYGITFMVFIALMIINVTSKLRTIYSFILKTQYLNIIIGLVVVFLNVFEPKHQIDITSVSLFFVFFYTTVINFYFTKKHIETVKKYKLS